MTGPATTVEDTINTTTRRATLAERYRQVRALTETLAEPLAPEDQVVQSMPDTSPTKWHRAHVTWFFETFLLLTEVPDYQVHHPQYGYLFNSYYEQAGARHPRPERGLLSRPTVAEVSDYRSHVDAAMIDLLDKDALSDEAAALVILGLHHEQQHQELLLMDIKHVFSVNPLRPAYRMAASDGGVTPPPLHFIEDLPYGMVLVGSDNAGEDTDRFCFDNESPRHEQYVRPFALADRLITNSEWLAFIDDGGYERPELWLSDGWFTVCQARWQAPLYWERDEDGSWRQFTLSGMQPLRLDEPVCHVSFFEADAYARWAGARLPTETEWELAAAGAGTFAGNTLGSAELHPRPAATMSGFKQLCGDVWEWTASPYLAYPEFRPAPGAVGEYNGKFMNGQYVLRGGCAVTPDGHVRPTYRNFFPPNARWAFSGVRLAR